MSSSPEHEFDEDPELLALRNELLNGLLKKNTKADKNDILSVRTKSNDKCSNVDKIQSDFQANQNEINAAHDNNLDEDEYELERLRAEALNAKRAKNAEAGSCNQNNDNHLKKNNKPGRFRYDKESEDDDDEDDYFDEDDILKYNKNNKKSLQLDQDDDNKNANSEIKSPTTIAGLKISNNHTNSIISQTTQNINFYLQTDNYETSKSTSTTFTTPHSGPNLEYVPTSMRDFTKYNKNNNDNDDNGNPNFHHNNYQTYRFECSKLMPMNAAYEPPSTTTQTTATNYDLRSFLKSKKSSRPQSPHRDATTTTTTHEQYSPKSLSDHHQHHQSNLEDLEYSLPITQPINISNEIYLSNYQHRIYNGNSNNKRGYLHNNNNFKGYPDDSKYKNNTYNHNNKQSGVDSNNNNNNCIGDDHNADDDDDDDDEDEDDDLSYKKMRSVVAKAIISNDKPNYSYRDSTSSRNYSSRYSPSKSNYNFYRRKHSNSASSK
jgi:hypothetical protein